MAADWELAPALEFLKGLKRNNRRDWFESHRAEYEKARAEFEALVGALIREISRWDNLGGTSPKDCIFRLNRDLRFSRDKSPYKTYFSAYMAPGGRKSGRLGYYLHLDPGDRSILGGGWHEPDPADLAKWRKAVARDARPFKAILRAAAFRKYFGSLEGETLKTAPQGFPKDHPELDLLRHKQLTISRSIPDRMVVSPRFLSESVATFRAMRPFLNYLDGVR